MMLKYCVIAEVGKKLDTRSLLTIPTSRFAGVVMLGTTAYFHHTPVYAIQVCFMKSDVLYASCKTVAEIHS